MSEKSFDNVPTEILWVNATSDALIPAKPRICQEKKLVAFMTNGTRLFAYFPNGTQHSIKEILNVKTVLYLKKHIDIAK